MMCSYGSTIVMCFSYDFSVYKAVVSLCDNPQNFESV